jgi:hypothetical protein
MSTEEGAPPGGNNPGPLQGPGGPYPQPSQPVPADEDEETD